MSIGRLPGQIGRVPVERMAHGSLQGGRQADLEIDWVGVDSDRGAGVAPTVDDGPKREVEGVEIRGLNEPTNAAPGLGRTEDGGATSEGDQFTACDIDVLEIPDLDDHQFPCRRVSEGASVIDLDLV